jgi:uracil permease
MANLQIGIKERPALAKWLLLSLQHVFAMFGATILVPLLTGLDIGVALVASGIGTLIYIVCTKGKVPVYLGSSFAYIGAISTAAVATGFEAAYVGLMVVGLIYATVALVIRFTGSGWLKKILPPVVIGPMIIIIGLGLAPVAISSAGFTGGQGWEVPVVAIITFLAVVGIAAFSKGFFKIIPFILAIIVGYVAAMIFGLVPVEFAFGFLPYPDVFSGYQLFQIPNFTFLGTYDLNYTAILTFAPIAFVTMAEHIGDHSVLGEICEEDFITDPGLDKTILGDGIATFVAAAIGGPANTTYGENTGVVALTKVGSVWVTGLAAIFAIGLGFLGYLQAFIASIPWAVIGGMTIVLYGLIAGNGVKVLIRDKTDLGKIRNLIIISTMLVIGLGGAVLSIGTFGMSGMALAAVIGIALNLVLPQEL